jgi:hypothetical protein
MEPRTVYTRSTELQVLDVRERQQWAAEGLPVMGAGGRPGLGV